VEGAQLAHLGRNIGHNPFYDRARLVADFVLRVTTLLGAHRDIKANPINQKEV
jgi:hypothetical protein